MSPALMSLLALLLVIAGSLTTRVNVGILAVALAWPIAIFGAKWKMDAMMGTFQIGRASCRERVSLVV